MVWWREGGWGKRKGSRNGGAIGVDRCLINIREVEVGGVLWTLLNILNGHRDQRCDSSGEETGLRPLSRREAQD